MSGCDSSLVDQLNLRLEEGLSLERDICQSPLSQVPGSSKLTKKIRQEIRFLQKHSDNGLKQLKREHLECSNLTHLRAVVNTLRACHHPTEVLKSFQFKDEDGGRPKKICVDVVADDGLSWIKVVARNSKAGSIFVPCF